MILQLRLGLSYRALGIFFSISEETSRVIFWSVSIANYNRFAKSAGIWFHSSISQSEKNKAYDQMAPQDPLLQIVLDAFADPKVRFSLKL